MKAAAPAIRSGYIRPRPATTASRPVCCSRSGSVARLNRVERSPRWGRGSARGRGARNRQRKSPGGASKKRARASPNTDPPSEAEPGTRRVTHSSIRGRRRGGDRPCPVTAGGPTVLEAAPRATVTIGTARRRRARATAPLDHCEARRWARKTGLEGGRNGRTGTRTQDPRLKRPLLCRLSYPAGRRRTLESSIESADRHGRGDADYCHRPGSSVHCGASIERIGTHRNVRPAPQPEASP